MTAQNSSLPEVAGDAALYVDPTDVEVVGLPDEVRPELPMANEPAKQALEIARQRGRFTIFSLVDALTRLSGDVKYAGDRLDFDQKASALLALAA